MPMKQNLIGQKFGRLTVIEPAESIKGRTMWNCLCDCGNKVTVAKTSLQSGNTRSCGCLRLESSVANIAGQKRKKIPMIGKRFGRLVVIEDTGKNKGKDTIYKCFCDCGKTVEVRGYCLRSGNTKSCGCLAHEARVQVGKSSKGRTSKRFIDLTGRRFGRLTVLRRGENSAAGQARWVCLCDCGRRTLTLGSKLRSGKTLSCGCLGLENATKAKITHGMSKTSLAHSFHAMHTRCESPRSHSYPWYGAKGIKVCDEWSTIDGFSKWALAHGWAEGLVIDRINPDEDYCPGNCRWVTQRENSCRVVHKKQ